MSTLHHESILEDCLVEAEENFRVHNKLTQKQLDELIVRSEGVRLAIEKQAKKLFDDRCILAPILKTGRESMICSYFLKSQFFYAFF